MSLPMQAKDDPWQLNRALPFAPFDAALRSIGVFRSREQTRDRTLEYLLRVNPGEI